MPNLIKVKSSTIDAIAYDEELRALYVRFLNGDVWEYADVDTGCWNSFRLDKSKGSYFAKFIRPHFEAKKYSTGKVQKKTSPRAVSKAKIPEEKQPETPKRIIRTGTIQL